METIKNFFIVWKYYLILLGAFAVVGVGAYFYSNFNKPAPAPVEVKYTTENAPQTVLTVNKKDIKAGKYDYVVNTYGKEVTAIKVDSALVTLTLSPVDTVGTVVMTKQACVSLVGFGKQVSNLQTKDGKSGIQIVFGKGKKQYTLGFVTKEGYITEVTKENKKDVLNVVPVKAPVKKKKTK